MHTMKEKGSDSSSSSSSSISILNTDFGVMMSC